MSIVEFEAQHAVAHDYHQMVKKRTLKSVKNFKHTNVLALPFFNYLSFDLFFFPIGFT